MDIFLLIATYNAKTNMLNFSLLIYVYSIQLGMLRYILHNENWQQPHTWNTEEECGVTPHAALFFDDIWGCTNSLKGNQNQYCRLLPTLANLNQHISCLLLSLQPKAQPKSVSFISFVIHENLKTT